MFENQKDIVPVARFVLRRPKAYSWTSKEVPSDSPEEKDVPLPKDVEREVKRQRRAKEKKKK